MKQTKASEQVMEEAYQKASTNDTLPALATQVMYAAQQDPGAEQKTAGPRLFHADSAAQLHHQV